MCCGCSSPPWVRATAGASEMQTKEKPANVAFMVFLVSSGGVFFPQDSGAAVPRPLEMRWMRFALRVQPLHLIEFLGRDLKQVPDEQNQAPGWWVGVRSVELLGLVAVSENWIELDPSHVCFGDKGHMAPGAFGCGGFFSPRRIRKWVMPEVEEAPSIRCSKSLAVFYGDIHAVEFAVEISSTGRFGTRTVGKGRIENARQFLDEDGSFGEGTGLEVHVEIFLFDVDVVVFGEVGFAVVEGIGC